MKTEQQKILAEELYDALDPECPGVTLGSRTVVGAGSVVTKDIPSGVFTAGNPCRVIRQIAKEHHD